MMKLKVLNDIPASSNVPAAVQRPLRVGLIALNWDVNTSLALWNLELFARKEPRIDQHVQFSQHCAEIPKSYAEGESKLFELLRWIREHDFDIVGFSCYIWNIQFINRVAKAMRKLMPEKKIVYGGQQIRGLYIRHLFEKEQCVDICVEDEGEISFRELLLHHLTGVPALSEVPGLTYLDADKNVCRSGPPQVVQDLNEIPSPYLGDIEVPYRGAFLIEASRGCPYKCSFCIWGEAESVREYDLDRVEKELAFLLSKKPRRIKFCDGTFNLKKDRVMRMLGFMVEKLRSGEAEPFDGLFEIRLELIDPDVAKLFDEFIALNPLFTLEFGLQTVNKTSSKMMQRPFFEARFLKAWETLTPRLRSLAVIDCIYGLPGDTRGDFAKTVDFAYGLGAHMIQCFRLSVLPGSQFERSAEEFGFKYSDEPDHNVFQTRWLSLDDMEWLEAFGLAVVDIYHFHRTTVACLLGSSGGFSSFSALLTDFVDQQGARRIFEGLYGNARPESRWRAIDLSAGFTDYVLTRALGELGITDEETRQKFVELLRYESMLGAMAIHSISAEDGAGECLIPNAKILKSSYDIPGFLAETRGATVADIGRLAPRDTTMALTQKNGFGGVKTPISYRISEALADVLRRFDGGRTTTEVVEELREKNGNVKAWHTAIESLRARKLLVGAPDGAQEQSLR